MKDLPKQDRMMQIETAAYALLAEKGYAGTSMLSVARAAKASNETLYRWYGDKQGLFAAMVASNASQSRETLEQALTSKRDPMASLHALAPVLLGMLTGVRAIALNRAAASDASGVLGAALATHGRNVIAPLIHQVITAAIRSGQITAPTAQVATDWFLSLLIGDMQIRRAIGAMPPPDPEEVDTRAAQAMTAFCRLTRPDRS